MEQKGITTYQLREKCGIDSKTVRRLRANEMWIRKPWTNCVSPCPAGLEDIAEYKEDQPVEKSR